MKSRLLLLLSVVMALVTVSCRSTRQLPVTPAEPDVTGASQLYRRIGQANVEWTDISVPVKLQLTSPTSLSVSGRVRMVRSRVIDLSLRMLGMEVAQLHITPDSVYAAYRLKKQYIAEGIGRAVGKFPVNIDNIQDLLLGRVFVLGHRSVLDVPMKSLDITSEGTGWNIIPQGAPSGMSYGFRLSETGLLERFVAYALDNSLVTTVGYSDYLSVSGGTVARDVAIEIVKGRRTVAATIEWKWNDASWNTGTVPRWNAPRGYKRLAGSDLMKMLSGF
ncbi:MAG: DUF4292 domain-containing protein [Pseudoflavonifractor sp.]|nr:DUF4292 domain-containing protein [Pseudoflavonifractor sp.]